MLTEGGNVFKGADGTILTQRINQADVMPTVKWLEQITGVDFTQDKAADGRPAKWLGSTGRKATSGDLDLLVHNADISKEQLAAKLQAWCVAQRVDPKQYIKKTGISVHFFTAIDGDPRLGFVQTDFMFTANPSWTVFFLSSDPASAYKGMSRNILLSSVAKAMGYRINSNIGLVDRTTNQLVPGGDNPETVAKILLTPQATTEDMYSVERIVAALKNDPKKDAKLSDFREFMLKSGTPLDENVNYTDVDWMARLRDRIMVQGMQPLIESSLKEAEEAGIGGKAKGIEHLEDYVFRFGTPGIQRALDIVNAAAAAPGKTTTVKWDGKPAVIFGRKPATGEFVLTDGSGFEAKGYDGLATSPKMMAQIQGMRKGDRTELISIYAGLFPALEAALPDNFRGYVKGDLLYYPQNPWKEEAGNYVFTPNTVTYRIPANSALGQKIKQSQTGVAMHTRYDDVGAPRQPLGDIKFKPVQGLLLVDPSTSVPQQITPDAQSAAALQQIIKTQGANITALFNPDDLRANKITDLARLCVDFVNTKVGQALPDARTLVADFGKWLQSKVSPQKFSNIVTYLKSKPGNLSGMAAAFQAFLLLHDIKENIRAQLDAQHPGQEGWVMATPSGYAKAVGRFNPDAFAAQNRAHNNPTA